MNKITTAYNWNESTTQILNRVAKNSESKFKILAASCWISRICRFFPMEDKLSFGIAANTLSPTQKGQINLEITPAEMTTFQVVLQKVLEGLNGKNKVELPGQPKVLFSNKLTEDNLSDVQLAFDWELKKVDFSINSDSIHWKTDSLVDHSVSFFEELLNHPKGELFKIPVISDSELEKTIQNSAHWDYTLSSQSLLDQFTNLVKEFGSKDALVFEKDRISYSELNQKSDHLALSLSAIIANNEKAVPVYMSKSVDFVVALLALVKLGKAYIPFDPKTVEYRFETWKENNPDHFFLNQEKFEELTNNSEKPEQFVPEKREANSHLYTMFTSGTTGEPKEVSISDKGVLSLCLNNPSIHFSQETISLSAADSSFDAFTLELWGTLLNGGTMVIHPNPLDLELFRQIIESEHINTMWLTSSLFNRIVDLNSSTIGSLKYLYIGGEKLSQLHVNKYKLEYPEVELYNGYGPTECTTFTHVHKIEETEGITDVPFGKTIAGRLALVNDSFGNILPVGVKGELRLGGEGLALSIGTPEDEAKKIVQYQINAEQTIKLYRSGDLGYVDHRGVFHYSGRIDRQLKINGYRIEAGEIEHNFQSFTGAGKAVLFGDVENNTKKHYLFYSDINEAESEVLIKGFKQNQPEFLKGINYQYVEEFPLNKNGKLDFRVLIDSLSETKEIQGPENEKEASIRSSFAKVLDRDPSLISIEDDFFEIGGDSLSCVSLCADLVKTLEITIADIHRCKTIRSIAKQIGYRNERLADAVMTEYNNGSKQEGISEQERQKMDALYEKRMERLLNSPTKEENLNTVMIVGANGFLGIHLVKELSDDPQRKVICLVRKSETVSCIEKMEMAFQQFFQTPLANNVEVVPVDFDLPFWRLGENELKKLGQSIDAVYNCCGEVAIFGDEEQFIKSNVEVVKQLIQFCKENKVSLHHTSTTMVADAEDKDWIFFTEFDQPVLNINERPYAKSKIMAELAIEEAVLRGVDARVYRIGNLSSSASTGKYKNEPDRNIIFRHIKSHFELGFFPDIEVTYEMLPVDDVATAIALLSRSNSTGHRYHLLKYTSADFARLVYDVLLEGFPELMLLKPEEYKEEMLSLLNDPIQSKYAEEWIVRSGFLADKKEVLIKNNFTNKQLEKLGFQWSKIDVYLLRKMISMLIDAQMFEVVS